MHEPAQTWTVISWGKNFPRGDAASTSVPPNPSPMVTSRSRRGATTRTTSSGMTRRFRCCCASLVWWTNVESLVLLAFGFFCCAIGIAGGYWIGYAAQEFDHDCHQQIEQSFRERGDA